MSDPPESPILTIHNVIVLNAHAHNHLKILHSHSELQIPNNIPGTLEVARTPVRNILEMIKSYVRCGLNMGVLCGGGRELLIKFEEDALHALKEKVSMLE